MKPGLDAIRGVCDALGNPECSVKAIHVAGTNGKGAVSAMIDAALRGAGFRTGLYTSPHLVRLNERFRLDGKMLSDEILDAAAARVASVAPPDLTFFEALTAVAFLAYAGECVDFAVLETGLGGRLDATNVCRPRLCVITSIGLDHCDWLGDTVGKIAFEKAGIIKSGVPVVLGANRPEVVEVVRSFAERTGSPFHYAPDIAGEVEIPADFPLGGQFNRENAVTAIAALKTLGKGDIESISRTVWPGRFHRIGNFIVDGAHNPPAAEALAASLDATGEGTFNLIAGFCADKDARAVLRFLAPRIRRAYAVRTVNPRSLSADDAAALMMEAGMDASSAPSLAAAIECCRGIPTVICGSLFLAGEALSVLGFFGSETPRFDPSELLRPTKIQ